MTDKERCWRDALVKVGKIMNSNGIEFFLDSGTFLGAVRDEKFIPWDNDIDLGILRDKYESEAIEQMLQDFFSEGYNVEMTNTAIYLTKAPDLMFGIMTYRSNGENYISELKDFKFKVGFLYFARNVKLGVLLRSLGHSIIFRVKRVLLFCKWFARLIPDVLLEANVIETVRKLSIPRRFFDDLSEMEFYGHTFLAPALREEYLVHRYGIDWKTPKEDYNYIEDDKALI